MNKWLLGTLLLAAASLQADHGYNTFYAHTNECYAQRFYGGGYYARPPIYSHGHDVYYHQDMNYYPSNNAFAEQQMRMNMQNPTNHPGMVTPVGH